MTNLSKETLLIIDDTLENLKILRNFFTRAGFEVLLSQEGPEAIKISEDKLPNLILLDIMMPGMDGFEVCKKLKEKEKTKNIPIIFMTALVDTVNKVRGFKLGAVDYITKPIQYEEVLARVTTHLNLRRLQQQLQEQNQQFINEIRVRRQLEEKLKTHANQLAERTQELEKRTVEVEKRNMELDAFAHTVAHDLKNPLSSIVGFTELLLDEYSTNPPPPYEDCLEKLGFVKRATEQMFNIIDALLLLAGVSRQAQMKIHSLDMSHIVNQVIQQRLVHMVKDYQGKIDVPNTLPLAQGYAPWVEEIWVNYLTNGLKYGGHPPHLEIGANMLSKGMIRFWVRDNGPGLSPAAQAQLFTPFTRLHQNRAHGHGLGLSIVQQIAEKLGGQVGVESVLGQGSLFYFTLPASNSVPPTHREKLSSSNYNELRF